MSKKRIKILFDAVPLSQDRPTGVGRTEAGLIDALARNYPDEIDLVGHYFDFLGRKKRRNFTGLLVNAPNVRYKRTVVFPGRVYNMLRRMKIPIPFELLVKERGDFHLFPSFLGWPSFFGTPSAPYIHDATFIDTPEYVRGPNLFDMNSLLPAVIKRSSFVITNTQTSANSLKPVYPWYKKPFVIAHIPLVNGVVLSRKESLRVVKKLGLTKPFILFHATLEPRKNLPRLIEAYRSSSDINSKYSLAISGGKGWKDVEITESINKAKHAGYDIHHLGYTSDTERAALFMNTKLYILPSVYEGFGMQLLEAFFYKTPSLASDIPVLREVGGDACEYTGTTAEEIADAMNKLMNDEARLKELVEKGKERIKAFDWDIVVKDVYNAIRKAVDEND